MPLLPLVLLATLGIAVRFVFARLAGCLLWVILAVFGVTLVLALAPKPGHAQVLSPNVLWGEQLSPGRELPAASTARGPVLSSKSELAQHPWPPGAHVLVASDPKGQQSIWADDLLRLRFMDASGHEVILEHDFRRADR